MPNEAKQLPGDVDLELRLVSGTLSLRKKADAAALLAGVPDIAFGNRGLRPAWSVMRELADAGALGTMAFAKECAERVPDGLEVYKQIAQTVTGANRETLERWAAAVKRLAHLRALVLRMDAGQRRAWNDADADPAEIETDLADAAREDIAAFSPACLPDIATVADQQAAFSRRLLEAKAKGSELRLGIPAVDAHCLLIPSYGVVMARTSHGKSAFSSTVAFHQLLAGKAPVIFSMEDAAAMTYTRMLSLVMKRGSRAAMGLVDDSAKARHDADEILRASKLTIVDGKKTPDQILAISQRLRDAGRCDIVFVDQLSRLDCQPRRGETKEQALTRASNRLVEVRKALGVPLILLAQLGVKHSLEHPDPAPSQIKDCSSVLEDACWQFVLDRPEADAERMEKLERQAAKLRADGRNQEATRYDVRGKMRISCTKDRNNTMGGTWRENVEFDASCGHVGRWHTSELCPQNPPPPEADDLSWAYGDRQNT